MGLERLEGEVPGEDVEILRSRAGLVQTVHVIAVEDRDAPAPEFVDVAAEDRVGCVYPVGEG